MYLLLKLLHITAVIAFLGNIATGFFWHAHAARSRDPRILAHVMDGVIQSDRLFTIPSVVTIVATGFVEAAYGGFPVLRTGWILWALVLFLVSGILFMVRVAPLQRQLRAFAEAGVKSGSFDFAGYRAIATRWDLWGATALLTPVGALILMVLKPLP